ncbi:MAG: ROK family transcriptional regulator [Chloroflexota bacterium]
MELLRERGPLSRQEIASLSGLSQATVNRLTADLARERAIVPDTQGPSSGGRPPLLYRYNGQAKGVVALDVGGTKTAGAVADLTGALIHREVRPTFAEGDTHDVAAATLERTLSFAADLVRQALRAGAPPRAVAIGVPGVVHPERGEVEWAPAIQWRHLPLARLATERLGIETIVENDVNLMAFGEHRRGVGRGTHHMIGLALGTGVGAGLILDGHLYRGWNDAAGEVGYLLVERSSLERAYPGFGDLESRIGGRGIGLRAHERGMRGPADGAVTAADVFAAARSGDAAATDLVSEIADEFALAVGGLAAMLAPELIVIGGGIGRSADLLIPRLRERLVGRVPHVPRIEPAALGDDATLIGAAELAIEASAGYSYVTSRGRLTR